MTAQSSSGCYVEIYVFSGGLCAHIVIRLSMKFDFDADKNELLFQTRGVTFYQIIETIAESGVLLNVPHPNRDQYPNQWMFVIEHNQYTYCVPYVIDGDTYFLKTIFPNRKYMYLLSEQEQGNGS
jgi:uncharacterized DUF497 family protein